MNKSAVTGFVVGAIVVTAAGAVAGYRVVSASRGAEVVSVKALSKTIKTPRQECHEVQVTRTKPVKDRDRLVGTGVGAVVGGLLGHEVGGGSGKHVQFFLQGHIISRSGCKASSKLLHQTWVRAEISLARCGWSGVFCTAPIAQGTTASTAGSCTTTGASMHQPHPRPSTAPE